MISNEQSVSGGPHKIRILADDLTSAADAITPFILSGMNGVIRNWPYSSRCEAQYDVIALDLDTRNCDVEGAVERTRSAVANVDKDACLFLTIDSTLRSHGMAVISAAFAASGRQKIVLAPAWPDAGRTTRSGKQYVDGLPVDQSDFAQDPAHRIYSADLNKFLPLDIVPVVIAEDVEASIAHRLVNQQRAVIIDATRQQTLFRHIAAIEDPHNVLFVGSPGLAMALASRQQTTRQPLSISASNRILIVIGSANAVSRNQIDYLQIRGIPIVLNARDIPSNAIIVCLVAPPVRQEKHRDVMSVLTREAIIALGVRDYDVLIASGGETMASILKASGVKEIKPAGELAPGFPCGHMYIKNRKMMLAMKAGGLGSDDMLWKAVSRFSALKNMDQTR